MEKRVIGILLTVLGIVGLIISAVNFVNHSGGVYNTKLIIVYGALGLIFFLAGLGLIRGTRDVIKKDEHIS